MPQPRPHCVRWRPSSLPQKGALPPNFRPMSIVARGWMDQDATWYGGRPRPRRRCVRWGPSSPKRGRAPSIFSPYLLWPNGWMHQDTTWYEGRPQPRPLLHWGQAHPSQKGTAPNFRPMFIVAKQSPISASAESLVHLCTQ